MNLDDLGLYVKTTILTILLGFETFVLGHFILGFVEHQNFFGFDPSYSIVIIIMMILILVTFALSVGAWNSWLQYIIIPIPIGLGLALTIVKFNFLHALLAGLVSIIILSYDVFISTKMKNMLIKFDPKMILRFTTKGILFIFSVFAGLTMILQTTFQDRQIDIGAKVAEIAKGPLESLVERQIDNTLEQNIEDEQFLLETSNVKDQLKDLDPAVREGLIQQGFGPVIEELESQDEPLPLDPKSLIPEINYEEILAREVNHFLEPYKQFVRPVMALLVFGLFQFYAFISSIIFLLLIDIVYWIAKKTGFFKVNYRTVEKEELNF